MKTGIKTQTKKNKKMMVGGGLVLNNQTCIRYMYNMYNNQHDALFILSLLSYHTSTCLGCISSPSSRGKMYTCGRWYS
jgi:hypothetical protein